MALREQRLAENVAYVLGQVELLEPIVSNDAALQDVLADPLRLSGVKYALQTAIEAIIDSMYHVAAQVYHRAPASAQDAADILLENQAIDADLHLRLVHMVGFRNRLVHNYQRIDLAILTEILRENLTDFRAWGQAIQPWLSPPAKD